MLGTPHAYADRVITDDALRFVLALDCGRQRLVIRTLHAVELQRAHHVEDFGPLHLLGS